MLENVHTNSVVIVWCNAKPCKSRLEQVSVHMFEGGLEDHMASTYLLESGSTMLPYLVALIDFG